jgi:hypothetical protein
MNGFKDPDSSENVTDPEHCLEVTFYHILSPVLKTPIFC